MEEASVSLSYGFWQDYFRLFSLHVRNLHKGHHRPRKFGLAVTFGSFWPRKCRKINLGAFRSEENNQKI